jgi:hypothetical protein
MASAASLNATATIVNGHGLSANPALISAITTYQSQIPITLLSNVFVNAQLDSNVGNVIIPVLSNIGSTATQGQFLLDIYPANITPVATAGIARYGNSLASTSGTIQSQANYPFSNGLAGFASGFVNCYGSAAGAVDIVGSLSMLNGKTYGQCGIGYTGITDLLTGGIGSEANLLGSIVAGWGTMYDATNINLITDPYVFGQNLLNQGLGTYGNLTAKLQATGLNTADITQAPLTGSITYPAPTTITHQSIIGQINLPAVENVTETTSATGNNPNVITAIYATITGNDLAAIVSATGFVNTGNDLLTLADYLDFNKVVGSVVAAQLAQYNVKTFTDFSTYLNSRISKQNLNTWTDIAKFLASISTPTLAYTTTTAQTPVLNSGTAGTLSALTGTGSGPFGNPVLSDYLGATAGIPYNTSYTTINSDYALFAGPIITAMHGLDKSVIDTYTAYYANVSYDSNGNASYGDPDTTMISSNVAKVNAALNSLTANTKLIACQTAYYTMLNSLSSEVSNLSRSGAKFTNSSSTVLFSFGQGISGYGGPDTTGLGADQIIGNLITNDAYGDTIRAAIAEKVNNQATNGNDPNPRQALSQSIAQNIPLSTYLSQNK